MRNLGFNLGYSLGPGPSQPPNPPPILSPSTHTHTHTVIIQAKEDDTCKQLCARLIKVVAVDNIILRDCICLLVTYLDLSRKSSKTAAPNLFFIRDWFCGRKSLHGPELGGGSGEEEAQVCYIHCALYFYYYYISSTSDHLVLDPRGGGPLT